jgi:hypothetical protein
MNLAAGFQCQIRVAECLESGWSEWFAGLDIRPDEERGCGGTVISGRLPDQAALYGLIGQIRDLGLTLLEVKQFD